MCAHVCVCEYSACGYLELFPAADEEHAAVLQMVILGARQEYREQARRRGPPPSFYLPYREIERDRVRRILLPPRGKRVVFFSHFAGEIRV